MIEWIAIGILFVWVLRLELGKASEQDNTELHNRMFGLAMQLGVDAKSIERPISETHSELGQIKRRILYLETQEEGSAIAAELTHLTGREHVYGTDCLIYGTSAYGNNIATAKQKVNELIAEQHRKKCKAGKNEVF